MIIYFLLNIAPLVAKQNKQNIIPTIEMLSSINTMEAYIGQYINYQVTIKTTGNIKYAFNDIKFLYTEDEMRIISSETNIKNKKDYTQTIYKYKIAFYNHGIYDMPSFSIEHFENEKQTILSNTQIYVSIKQFSDGQYLPTIKNNEHINIPWYVFIIIIAIIIFIIIGIILILFLIKKRDSLNVLKVYEPEDIEALKELGILENKIGLNQISLLEYYFILTQIFRKYLTSRFELPILEMTTDDIRRHMSSRILPNYKNILIFLSHSDFIKFSKLQSDKKKCMDDMRFCEAYKKKYGRKKKEEKEGENNESKHSNKKRNK